MSKCKIHFLKVSAKWSANKGNIFPKCLFLRLNISISTSTANWCRFCSPLGKTSAEKFSQFANLGTPLAISSSFTTIHWYLSKYCHIILVQNIQLVPAANIAIRSHPKIIGTYHKYNDSKIIHLPSPSVNSLLLPSHPTPKLNGICHKYCHLIPSQNRSMAMVPEKSKRLREKQKKKTWERR